MYRLPAYTRDFLWVGGGEIFWGARPPPCIRPCVLHALPATSSSVHTSLSLPHQPPHNLQFRPPLGMATLEPNLPK